MFLRYTYTYIHTHIHKLKVYIHTYILSTNTERLTGRISNDSEALGEVQLAHHATADHHQEAAGKVHKEGIYYYWHRDQVSYARDACS